MIQLVTCTVDYMYSWLHVQLITCTVDYMYSSSGKMIVAPFYIICKTYSLPNLLQWRRLGQSLYDIFLHIESIICLPNTYIFCWEFRLFYFIFIIMYTIMNNTSTYQYINVSSITEKKTYIWGICIVKVICSDCFENA